MKKQVIFFDWDGTLQSCKASEYANVKRTQMFANDISEEKIKKLQRNSHNNHYVFVQNLMRQRLSIKNTDELKIFQAVIFGAYYIMYVQDHKENCLLVDMDRLRSLKEKYNLTFVIVTSLYEVTIKTVLEILGLDDLFEVYACSINLKESKYDSLKQAFKNYSKENFQPLMMIGDRGEDVEAGTKLQLKTVYCDYGHGDSDFGADYIIQNPENFIDELEKILKN
jgi:phosphoglycolate phosphatase-like HAD superfamily hydrolase